LRTQDKNTETASSRLFKAVKTPEEIIKMPVKKLERLIYSSGHYRKKARVLKSVSKEILERFNGKVPKNKEELLSIKGVGPKTANIVLCFAYGKNVIPVDTHVHRIPNRLGWVKTKKPEETERELMRIIPKKYWREINTTLILHGKNICKPISPLCSRCVISKECNKTNVLKKR
jgi:endonuclease-3